MKTIQVVAAVIKKDGKILLRNEDTVTLKEAGSFLAERLNRMKHLKKLLFAKSRRN